MFTLDVVAVAPCLLLPPIPLDPLCVGLGR